MLEAANQGLLPLGKRHFMDFELRCAPPVMRARELVFSGSIGAVKFISVNTMMDFSYCQLNATHGHWNLREMGGGVWSGTGTHFADLARHILGREVARVSCVQSPMVEQLRDADGLMQRCTVGWAQRSGAARHPLPILWLARRGVRSACTVIRWLTATPSHRRLRTSCPPIWRWRGTRPRPCTSSSMATQTDCRRRAR
jgi:hypothetical protein